jgi:hypothetical protein
VSVSRHPVHADSASRGTNLFVLVNAIWRLAGRALLLALWCAVLWGTLLVVAMAVGAFSEGVDAVLSRLDPRGRPGLVPWINAACVALAPFAWASIALFLGGGRGPKAELE